MFYCDLLLFVYVTYSLILRTFLIVNELVRSVAADV